MARDNVDALEQSGRETGRSAVSERELMMKIIESLPGIFYIFDGDGRYLHWNSEFSRQSGYSDEEMAELNPLDLVPVQDRERVEREIRKTFETGAAEVEVDFLDKAGERKPYLFNGRLTFLEGRPCLVGLGIDVSDRQRVEKSLRESEARYRSFIENSTEGVFSFEVVEPFPIDLPPDEQVRRLYQSRVVTCNDALAQMNGYDSCEDLLGLTLKDLHGGDDIPENLAFLHHWIANDYRIAGAESIELDRQGEACWFENQCVGVIENGLLVRAWGSQVDITRRKTAEQRLRLSASVFENIADGIFITGIDDTIVDVNQAFTDITSYTRDEVLGQSPDMLQSGGQDDNFFSQLWETLNASGQWRGEIWIRRRDGSVFPVLMTVSRVTDDDGLATHYVYAFSDISQIKQSQERLDYLAHHDPLTDLPNRTLLGERLEWSMTHARRNGQSFAVLFVDLDHFKHVNDSLGHTAGDRLLQDVARRLVDTLRQEDTVARLGGDEFVLVLEDIAEPHKAASVAGKLMRALAEPFDIEGREIRVLASMGICLYPRDGEDAATLLRNADAAMFRAKDRGRNTYEFYTEELTRNAFERVLLESNLRRALYNGELFLQYQPQLDLATGAVVGLEALSRWHHPDLGLVSPSKFIPLAEETGLIHPIGEWVLRSACQQGQRWREAGIDFGRLAVNVSRAQLQRGRLFEEVEAALSSTAFPAELLELEVTESFIMQQDISAVEQLDRLRDRGVSIAIDDFGTGYSSLSYLKRLPVHKLKIDKSFVVDIPQDENDMAIAAAVISIGRKLGLTVLAEGVESEEQAAFLRDNGCQEAQGYVYARPLGVADVTAFLQRHRARVDDKREAATG